MKKFFRKYWYLVIILIVIIAVIGFPVWLFNDLKNHINSTSHIFDYWNIFWTCIGALAVPLAIISYLVKQQREKKNKLNDYVLNVVQKELPKFWELSKKKELKHNLSKDEYYEFLSQGISLLITFEKIIKEYDINDSDSLSIYMTLVAEKMNSERGNFEDEFALDTTLDTIIKGNQKESLFGKVKKMNFIVWIKSKVCSADKIETNSVISKEPNSYDSNFTNQNKNFTNQNKREEILIVRTVRTSSLPDFMGDWKISADRASSVGYVIGIQGYVNQKEKEYKGIKAVDKETLTEDGRIKFIEKTNAVDETKILSKIKNNISDKLTGDKKIAVESCTSIEEIVNLLISETGWKGINPTVYMSHLVERYRESHDGKQ